MPQITSYPMTTLALGRGLPHTALLQCHACARTPASLLSKTPTCIHRQDKDTDDVEGLFDRARQAGAVDGTQADLRPGGGGGGGGAGW